jgi:hypothetical protein
MRRAPDDPRLAPSGPREPPETDVVVVAPDAAVVVVVLIAAVGTPDFDLVLTAELVGVATPVPAGVFAVVGVLLAAADGLAVVVGVTGLAGVCAGGTSVDALQICA